MAVVIAHPTGNEFFRAALNGLYQNNMLSAAYTAIASFPGTWLHKLGAKKQFSDINRRAYDKKLEPFFHTHPRKEIIRLLSVKAGFKRAVRHEAGRFSVDAIYHDLDRLVAKNLEKEQRKGAKAIYAYEDGALYSFLQAKKTGMKRLYDLPIGYWRAMHELLSIEKEINPEWATTLSGLQDSKEKLYRKDEEINNADCILVASSFTAGTLQKFPGTCPAVKVVPYGFPAATPKAYNSFKTGGKLKLLFVGGLSQRKGISYLFEAVRGLEDRVSLTIVGRSQTKDCRPLQENLEKHKWIESLPHAKVLSLMREHDVLVFPSLFEGFGQVITEAMAQGTPVITTERTAGPDLIEHQKNGWLVKAGSAEELKAMIEYLLQQPQLIESVGNEALKTAQKRPWTVYGNELAATVKENIC